MGGGDAWDAWGELALALGAADHAFGDEVIDLGFRVSEFRQHLAGVLAEFWRHIA